MQKLKKFFAILIILALVLSVVISAIVSFGHVNSAQAGFMDSFKKDEQVTFTQYGGKLATLNPEGYDPSLVAGEGNLKNFILIVVNYALGFLGLMAVLMIIYGGVLYVTSAGNDDQTGTAKKVITYAAVGLLIVMGSFAFVNTIISSVVGEDTTINGADGAGGIGGFNAMAEELRQAMEDIYSGYVAVAETTDEFLNIQADAQKASIQSYNLPERSDVRGYLLSIKSKLASISGISSRFSLAQVEIQNLQRTIDKLIDQFMSAKYGSEWIKVDGSTIDTCEVREESVKNETKDAWAGGGNNCSRAGYKELDRNKDFFDDWAIVVENLSGTDDCSSELTTYLNCMDQMQFGIDLRDDGHATPSSADCETTSRITYKTCIDAGEKLPVHNILMFVIHDYLVQLNKNIIKIEAIYEKARLFEVIAGDPNYDKMKGGLDNLKGEIERWGSITDINLGGGGKYLLSALEGYDGFYKLLTSIKAVNARLKADITEGSAPLAVLFSVGESYDPAGGSITNENVKWDYTGQYTKQELIKTTINNPDAEAGTEYDFRSAISSIDEELPAEVVECNIEEGVSVLENETLNTPTDVNSAANQEAVGDVMRRCTFKRPGTYKVAVIINSNDRTKFAPGMNYITIKVNPPTTKINLDIEVSSGDGDPKILPVMRYLGDQLIADKQIVAVLANEVNDLTFNATDTNDGAVSNLVFKWDFGNGKMTESTATVGSSTVSGEGYGAFDVGDYKITLNVQNQLGVTDKKSFTLRVADIVARATVVPRDKGFVGQNVILDGSGSRTSSGVTIRNYAWKIYPLGDQECNECIEDNEGRHMKQSGTDLQVLQYEFKEGGDYKIELVVTSQIGGQASLTANSEEIYYTVESAKPTAIIDYQVPNQNFPAEVHLDASGSFDEDATEGTQLTYEWKIDGEAEPTSGKWVSLSGDSWSTQQQPIIQFLQKGKYKISLIVNNGEEASTEAITEINIEKALDARWGGEAVLTGKLETQTSTTATEESAQPKIIKSTPIAFTIESRVGVAY
ncbi:MAG: REJ domain-containing protein, partial [Candidatus Gracilibacteria bacterium]